MCRRRADDGALPRVAAWHVSEHHRAPCTRTERRRRVPTPAHRRGGAINRVDNHWTLAGVSRLLLFRPNIAVLQVFYSPLAVKAVCLDRRNGNGYTATRDDMQILRCGR